MGQTAPKTPSATTHSLFTACLREKQRADERTRTADLISLRVRFGLPYLSRKVAYLPAKVSAAYRPVTPNYAQVSVPVSVRRLPTELEPATFFEPQVGSKASPQGMHLEPPCLFL